MALTDKLTAIANAIRAKTGKTAKMTMTEMVTEIEGISGGGGDTSIEDSFVTRTVTEYTNDRVTTVGTYAFYNCSSLTSASFPLVMSIGSSAFYNCSKLTTVELPKATSIGSYVFQNCKSLKALVIRTPSSVCTLNGFALASTSIASGTGYIYVPDDLVDSYKAATNWSTYADQIKPLSEYTGG